MSALLIALLMSCSVEASESAAANPGGLMIEGGLIMFVAVMAAFSAARAGWSIRAIIGLSLAAGGVVAVMVSGL